MYTNASVLAVALINTVADNRSSYTNCEYSRAMLLARKIQIMIGRPASTHTLMKIDDNNLLSNCPNNRSNIAAAENIFGPDLRSLEGKTIYQAATWVEAYTVNIPEEIMSQYRDIILAGHIMFVNKIPFFMLRISRYIKFGTAKMI